jgi:hypothetical protein
MVKHQRRSHQRGIHSNDMLDDCTSESESGESPATPKHSGMQWPVHSGLNRDPQVPHHGIHRAAQYSDLGHHQMSQYAMAQSYGHRHASSNGPHEYPGQTIPSQHPGVQMLHRATSIPQTYYITEQNNPGVATMNTNPLPPQYHMSRPPVERLAMEIPYSAPGMTSSVQSSPSTFSASGRSPSLQEAFYTHQPTQTASYTLHSTSSVDQQPQASMVSYPSPIPPPVNQQSLEPQQQQMPRQSQSQEPAPPPSSEQYAPAAPQAEADHWYSNVPYQAPVEVATITQIPSYGTVYDPWGPKMEFEDPTMPLPSARISTM